MKYRDEKKDKIKMYELPKIKIQELIKNYFCIELDEDSEKEFLIKQQESPLFRQMNILRGHESEKMKEMILVEARKDNSREDKLIHLLRYGFYYNGKHFVRYGKSASQAKDGITVFIEERYHEDMKRRSMLDLNIDKTVISKYESYRNLIMSSCQTVEKKLPYIVIVDEYETSISNQHIRYAKDEDVEVLNEKTGEIKKYKNKVIKEGNLDIPLSPFDGFGVHTRKVSNTINKQLGLRKDTVLYQIRLPLMKGVSVEMDFKRFYRDRGVDTIVDVFGRSHKVKNIDCIWNTSMWKGYGDFRNEFGDEGWNQYIKKVNKYGFQLGISKYNHHMDDINHYSRLNFQYLQTMDLINEKYVDQFNSFGTDNRVRYDILDESNDGKIVRLAKYSTNLMEKIIKGDKLYTLKFLGMGKSEIEDNQIKSNYTKAILLNDRMLKDPSIKKMLRNKLDKTIEEMKYGKIYAKGFYHTVIGDVKGYLEYAGGLEIKGSLDAGEFHANSLEDGDCLSLRSPLVDPSEVHKVKLVHNDFTNKYLRHLHKKDICMINIKDLTMQIQGGMDMDGDQVFLCNDDILLGSKIDLPSVVDMSDKETANPKEYNDDNIIEYEKNSRDSRIGEITNIATSILNQYTQDEKWKKINQDNIAWLRLAQGKEIDFLKTGSRWFIPPYMRDALKKIPYFLLYNYPKKLKTYRKIGEVNREVEEKIPYNAYRSPSALNELCDYICQWEKRKIDWNNELNNNLDLVVNNSLDLSDRQIMREISIIYGKYNRLIKLELDRDDDDKNVDRIIEDCRNELTSFIGDERLASNYCIKVAYRSISRDKTLCWMVFGDEIIKNIEENSSGKEFKIVQTIKNDRGSREFLGKYYKLIEE